MKILRCRALAFALLLLLLPIPAFASTSVPEISVLEDVVVQGDAVLLTWTGESAGARYDLCISKAPYGEENLIVDTQVVGQAYRAVGLAAGSYRANVKGEQSKAYSDPVYFTVQDPYARRRSAAAVDFLWPVKEDEAYDGSSFCITAMDVYYDGGKHGTYQNALDINSNGMKTRYATREIVSVADGEVIEVHTCGHSGMSCRTRRCEGNYIRIRHVVNGTTYISAYQHLDPKTIAVKKGDLVTQGQTIARMGNSGNSSGVHLHFSIRDAQNEDLPTLEFYMNDTYSPKLVFKYYKRNSKGLLSTSNGKLSRYSNWISENFVYTGDGWTYAGADAA